MTMNIYQDDTVTATIERVGGYDMLKVVVIDPFDGETISHRFIPMQSIAKAFIVEVE